MFERLAVRLRRRRVLGLAFLTGAVLLLGCASDPNRYHNLVPILPTSESRLETASPAARDALREGLQWIATDAPNTKVETLPSTDSTKRDEP